MAIVPPTMIPENEKGYFNDNDVEKAKEYLQKGLEELGYKDVSELPKLNLFTIPMRAIKKLPKPSKICGEKILGVEVTLNNEEWKVYLDNFIPWIQHCPYGLVRGLQ